MKMILDLRYINKHLRSCRFKYEDLRTATNLFEKDGYFFKWDYKSGYHHIDILQEHQKYLGFSMEIEGQVFFFAFTVLPFGLSTGPYIFTKVQKPLVRHWRAKGFRILPIFLQLLISYGGRILLTGLHHSVQGRFQDLAQNG